MAKLAKKAGKTQAAKKKVAHKTLLRKKKPVAKVGKAARKSATDMASVKKTLKKVTGKKKPAKKPAVKKAAKKKTAKPALKGQLASKPVKTVITPAAPKPVAVPGSWPFPMTQKP